MLNRLSNQAKVVTIASIGALFECYDFMICAFLASFLVKIFFAGNNALGIFTIFTIAFVSRPIGGIFWGHLGDKYGRKIVFSVTMMLLAVPTLLIAAYPTQISTSLNVYGFMLLRFLQGFLVGGEFPGGVTFIAEIASAKRRGMLVSIFMAALTVGTLLASAMSLLIVSVFSSEQILAGAWRIPFILSVFLIFIAIYIRKKVSETPFFINLAKRKSISKMPFWELLSNHPKTVIIGIIITSCSAFGLTTCYTFLPSLIKLSGIFNEKQVLNLTTLGSLVVCIFMPVFGIISDKIGRKLIFLISSVLLLGCLGIFYSVIVYQSYELLIIAVILVSIVFSGINGLYCVILSELFPTTIRFSGVATCYTVAYSVSGGLLPLLYLAYPTISKNFSLPIIVFGCLLFATVISMYRMREMHGVSLGD